MDIVERLRNEPELTPEQYWEAQADMWHQKYKEATNEIEQWLEQAHYDYENGLKKDLEIARLREEISLGEKRGYRMGYDHGYEDGNAEAWK